MSGDVVIQVEDLCKRYPDSSGTGPAVSDVSLEVEKGEIVVLLGQNGAGKTTTLKTVLGLVVPTRGRIDVDGIDPVENPRKVYEKVSAVLEGVRNVYWRLTVLENLRFYRGIQGHDVDAGEKYREVLEKFDIWDERDQQIRHLSRGQQQKAAIACSLVRQTPVIILDEPTLGLDVETTHNLERELKTLAREDEKTIILSSHDMDVVQEVCDRVVIMTDGEITVDDSVENLLEIFRKQVYSIEVDDPILADGGSTSSLDSFEIRPTERDVKFEEYEVTIPGDRSVYELMDELEKRGVQIRNIRSVEPDLEEIFLDVTEEKS